jgi:hypothetical protein
MASTSKHVDHYQSITNTILAALDQGVRPWARPWSTSGGAELLDGSAVDLLGPLPVEIDHGLERVEAGRAQAAFEGRGNGAHASDANGSSAGSPNRWGVSGGQPSSRVTPHGGSFRGASLHSGAIADGISKILSGSLRHLEMVCCRWATQFSETGCRAGTLVVYQ